MLQASRGLSFKFSYFTQNTLRFHYNIWCLQKWLKKGSLKNPCFSTLSDPSRLGTLRKILLLCVLAAVIDRLKRLLERKHGGQIHLNLWYLHIPYPCAAQLMYSKENKKINKIPFSVFQVCYLKISSDAL